MNIKNTVVWFSCIKKNLFARKARIVRFSSFIWSWGYTYFLIKLIKNISFTNILNTKYSVKKLFLELYIKRFIIIKNATWKMGRYVFWAHVLFDVIFFYSCCLYPIEVYRMKYISKILKILWYFVYFQMNNLKTRNCWKSAYLRHFTLVLYVLWQTKKLMKVYFLLHEY